MIKATLALIIATVAWGALAVGAVYPWGFVPLAIAAALAGAGGVLVGDGARLRGVLAALGLVAIAIGLQLVPVSASMLTTMSPETANALRQLDPAFAIGAVTDHPLSIHPAATRLALLLFLAFSLLLAGTAGLLSRTGAERLVIALVVVAVIVAFAGIIQRSFSTGRIYGLWSPIEGRNPFGPFVNKNHFAGWMLMALPLTLGLFCAGVARGMRGVKPELRERLLWFSSPDASKIVLQALAASIMLLALVLTFSRSGSLAASLTLVLIGVAFLRSTSTFGRKFVVAGVLIMMLVGVVNWVGTESIVRRFEQADMNELGARRGAWEDAWSVAKQFPLTGSGINTYGTSMLLYQRNYTDKHFSAAHNDWLQIAAEGGLLVGIPFLIALALLIREIRRRMKEDRGSSYYWLRAGAVVALIAIGLQEIVDFSLQMPGNAAMFAVVCAIAIHKRPSRRDIVAPAP